VAASTALRDHAALLRLQRHYLDVLLSATQEKALAGGRREELLLRVLEGKGISAAALGGRRAALLEGADPEARAVAEELTPLRRRLADLLLQGPGNLSPQRYREECAAVQRQVDDLERDLGLKLQAFALLQRVDTATPADLAARLPGGTVLVETVLHNAWLFATEPGKRRWGPPRYAALLLWAGSAGAPRQRSQRGAAPSAEVRVVDLGEAAPLEQAVAAWRAAVQQGRTDPKAERALRERVWAPLAGALPERENDAPGDRA
jgi:hypothetical protein